MNATASIAQQETRPNDDRVALWYGAPQLRPGHAGSVSRWILVPLLFVAAACCYAQFSELGLFGVMVLVVAPTILLLDRAIKRAEDERLGQATLADISLLENSDAWLAHAWIVQNGVVTGQDRGVVWFEEGAMGFLGHQTSFLLTQEDVARVQDVRNRVYGGIDSATKRYMLSLREPNDERWRRRNVYLHLRLLVVPACELCPPIDQFEVRFRRFYQEASELQPQFPPLTVGPGAASLAFLRLFSVMPAVVLIASLISTLYVPYFSGLDVEGIVFILGLANFCAYGFSKSYRRQLGHLQDILKDEGSFPDRYARFTCLLSNIPLCALGILGGGTIAGIGAVVFLGGIMFATFGMVPQGLSLIPLGSVLVFAGAKIIFAGFLAYDRACNAPIIVRKMSPQEKRRGFFRKQGVG